MRTGRKLQACHINQNVSEGGSGFSAPAAPVADILGKRRSFIDGSDVPLKRLLKRGLALVLFDLSGFALYYPPNFLVCCNHGRVPERSKGVDCKSTGVAFGGSNPPPTTIP